MRLNKNSVKNIIIVTNPAVGSGVARVQKELISEWIRQGNNVYVIQIIDDREKPKITNQYGNNLNEIIVYCLDKNPIARFISKNIKVSRLLKQKTDSIVVAMTGPAVNLMGFMSIFIKNKVIISERNDPSSYPTSKSKRLLRDAAFIFPDVCVFQTEAAKNHFSKITQKKGVVIHNPINPLLPKPYEGDRRKVIVAIGRLHTQKNYPMMLCAFKSFVERHDNYILEIYGNGELKKELMDLTKNLGIEKNVKFMGFVDNIYDSIKDASMYISSSNYEGICNSMLEALAMGIPTICTDCPAGGAREMIEDGVNGLLVPVGDVDALCVAMCKVAGDPEFAEMLGRNGQKIREKYPVEKIAAQWLDVINSK